MGADRPDLQYSAKELMRRISCPTESDEKQLKRLGRYLVGARRLYVVFRGVSYRSK